MTTAALGGFIWWLVLVFGCASYLAYRAAALVRKGDRLVFDRAQGLSRNGRVLAPLADIKETKYEKTVHRGNNRQVQTVIYRLFLVFEVGNRLPLCSGTKIEALNDIAERLEKIFAIPMNLDALTPTSYF